VNKQMHKGTRICDLARSIEDYEIRLDYREVDYEGQWQQSEGGYRADVS
jgi:hypothetical protein